MHTHERAAIGLVIYPAHMTLEQEEDEEWLFSLVSFLNGTILLQDPYIG
jgi:hypothetical protein